MTHWRPALPRILARLLVLGLASAALARDGDEGAGCAAGEADPGASRVSAGRGGLLEIHLRDVSIADALEMLAEQLETNVVCGPSVTGNTTANLYGVTLDEALRAILHPRGFAYYHVGNTVVVGTQTEVSAASADVESRVFRLSFISAAEAEPIVKSLLGEAARVVRPGGAGAGGDGEASGPATAGRRGGGAGQGAPTASEYLIVTDTRARLSQVQALLEQVDVRPRQVLIEATMLRATLTEDNRYGIDFSLLGGVDFENVDSLSNAGGDLQTGLLPQPALQNTTVNVGTDFAGAVQGGGFRFGIIHNSIAAFVRALEGVTDVTVVANPKVVALNRQEGEVIVGRRDGYLTTTVTQTAAVQTVDFLETGTQIRFTPAIINDETVRLDVHPKDSSGGLTSANLPFEETTEAHTNILLRDGHTVLIGGLFRERTIASSQRIPLLGNLPLAGLLFQNRTDQTVREEVIILLTVHILKESKEEAAVSDRMLHDVERVRIGARRGVLGTGRERLAQVFYQEAVGQLDRGDRDAALFNVEMALQSHPRHHQALRLRERLRGEQLWDDEGDRIRGFALELIRLAPPGDSEPSRLRREEPTIEIPPAAVDDED